jgi:succinoglycan biosynthesis transport protein ExoP
MTDLDTTRDASGAIQTYPAPMERPDVLEDRKGSFLTQLLTIFRRRKWVVLGSVIACLVLGLIITLLMKPQYTATSTVEIQREMGNFADVQGADQKGGFLDQEFYATQYGLLQSRALAERVATNLRLSDDPNFFATFDSGLAEDWFRGRTPIPGASTRDLRVRIAGELLLAHFEVNPGRLSRLVELRFTSASPDLARKIVDAWSNNFVEATLERRMNATSYARTILERRLAQLRDKIDTSERRLVDYASAQGIVNLPGGASSDGTTNERSLVGDDLANLNRELTLAVSDRIRAESRLSSGADTAEALTSPTITGIRQRRAELSAEYARLMAQFEPNYPPAVALKNQIQRLDETVKSEEGRIGGTVRSTYEAALERENALKTRVTALKSNVLDLRRRSIEYNIIQRDADTSRQLYDALLQRYKAIGVAGGIGATNISVVDPAETPRRPSRPRVLVNMLLALVAGLGLGVLAAWAMEQIEQSISDPNEVEQDLYVPLLGAIPKLTGEDPLTALRDRKSMTSEAYVSLLTRLSFSTDHGVPRVLAVTSSQPAEGKTTTSFALASAIARTQRSVILVDADMRSPSLHHLTGLANDSGLSNYLAGDDTILDHIQQLDQSGPFVIVAGPRPPSTPELLASERFDRLIAELLQRFDHVIFDAPPVMGLADAPTIASRVSANVFIIEAHRTSKKSAETAIERLKASRGNVVGAVLTKFDNKRSHLGYGYGYGYGYGHSYGAKDG